MRKSMLAAAGAFACLCTALGLALANPSATLSVTIVPVPPPPPQGGGSVPAAAQDAGFTTLADDYEFSQPQYGSQSNWLDCGGNNGGYAWHRLTSNNGTLYPCNVNQGTDPTSGETVLDMQWLQSYNSLAPGGQAFVTIAGRTSDKSSSFRDYGNAYFEAVLRQDVNVSNGGPQSFWSWNTNNDVQGGGAVELDHIETFGNGGFPFGSGTIINWGTGPSTYSIWQSNVGGKNSLLPSGYSVNDYHKYGTLLTSDGRTTMWACQFVDDILQGCAQVSANRSGDMADRHYVILWVGGTPPVGGSEHLYVKSVRVWTCASWNDGSQGSPPYTNPTASAQCNGSSLVNSGGSTYWR